MCVGAGSLTGSGDTAGSEPPCASSNWTKKEAKAVRNTGKQVHRSQERVGTIFLIWSGIFLTLKKMVRILAKQTKIWDHMQC